MKRIAVLTIVLVAVGTIAVAYPVTSVPDPPEAGLQATLTYDPTGTPLEGSTTIYMHYGYNAWQPVATDVLMGTNGVPFNAVISVPSQATEINMVFFNDDDPAIWDDNDGWDYQLITTDGVANPNVGTVPDPVQADQDVTVTYDPASGPLDGASPVYMHYGFNNWNPTQPDVLMTSNGALWEATVPVKSYASELDITFRDDEAVPTYDTNDGFDWRLPVVGGTPGVSTVPDPPVAGQQVTIRYNPEDTVLADADPVYLHYGYDGWNPTFDDIAMSTNGGDIWEVTVTLSSHACTLDMVFNDGDAIWDNNGGNDWHIAVDGCQPRVAELDSLYLAKYEDFDPDYDMLYVGVPGNLENDGSAMVIFIDVVKTGLDGQSELKAFGAVEPPDLLPLASARMDLLACSTIGMGTTLPLEADYALFVNYSGNQVHLNEYRLNSLPEGTFTCCDGGALNIYASQLHAGSTDVNDGNRVLEDDLQNLGYEGGFNDASTGGLPENVTTGLEVGIPVYQIGEPANHLGRTDEFHVFVAIMPNNGGVQGQFGNQTLPPVNSNGPFCDDPTEIFPLRADVASFTTAHTVASFGGLPDFGAGVPDGDVDPANYGGSSVTVQECPPAEPVADTTVTVQPNAMQNEDVTVWYVSTNGPLDGATNVDLNFGYDGIPASPTTVQMSPTNGFTGSEWIATITMPPDALQLDVNFSSNGTTDDNYGQDWHFEIGRIIQSETVVLIDPDNMTTVGTADAGDPIIISYDASGGPLDGEAQVCAHVGFNGWSFVMDPDPEMTRDPNCIWQTDPITVPPYAWGDQGLNVVFNNCVEPRTWDNNDGQDWHFEVINTAGAPPWTIDGYLDPCAHLIDTSTNGEVHLYAGYDDGFLYMATERANDLGDRDHTIFVGTIGLPMWNHPWAKAGQIAGWDVGLIQEEDSGYTAWFNLDTVSAFKVAQNMDLPYLEAQFDLLDELGFVPPTIHIAVGVYETGDGVNGELLPAYQVPEGNGDGDITTDEYIAIDLIDIPPEMAGDFDVDCDVDLDDYAEFVECLVGPGGTPGGGCTVDADFDDDTDVDLDDFAAFQQFFTG